MPLAREQLDRELGRFTYIKLAGGKLQLNREWREDNLTYIDAPWALRLGWGGYAARIRCHRRVAQQLLTALTELQDRGLSDLIDTYDGAWTPRLVRGGSTPSPHCWGHALDLNASAFPMHSDKQQDPRLVEVMARHGFECGQVWQNRKDPMHFEAIRFSVAESAPASTVDEVAVMVGGRKVAAGRLEAGRVVAPVAPVARALGQRVVWDGAGRRVIIG
jgi:hypothetical protein